MPPDPSFLWKQMPAEKRALAAEAFWAERDGVEQQVEAMALIARQHNFRLKFVQALPRAKKVRYLLALSPMPESLAARLLVSYHLAHQRDMLVAFLEAVGIEHENGLISQDPEGPIPADRLKAAAAALEGRFPADDVALYFATLLTQDPEIWAGLEQIKQVQAS
jgi:hypothetical protein